MALHTTLLIYKHAFDLFGIVTSVVKNMPRDHKASLGRRIQNECLDILILTARANAAEDKTPHLLKLGESIHVIELTIRLACDQHIISKLQYAAVIELTESIGKQCTGWRKSSANAVPMREVSPRQEQLSF